MTQTQDTDVLGSLREVVAQADAGKVFGTPVTQDGTVLLPVARIGSGGGGGGGTAPDGNGQPNSGTGGGFGMSAKALGVYVLRDGQVKWLPAVDVNRIVLGGQVVAVVGLLVLRAVVQARSSARKRRPGITVPVIGPRRAGLKVRALGRSGLGKIAALPKVRKR
jgi:uncharacterized spore protein YtfJ